jgi:histidine phosphotransferase ChpT
MYDPPFPDEAGPHSKTGAPELSDLLGSRICHDLISPLGAIANGVELLSLSGHADIPEIALIAESVEAANARIRFFRVAFGQADGHATLSSREIAEILATLGKSGRIRTEWQPDGPIPRPEAKLAFLMILCAETAMPRGGRLRVGKNDGTWRIDAETQSPKVSSALWNVFGSDVRTTDATPGDAHFPLAARSAAALGRTVAVKATETGFTLSF